MVIHSGCCNVGPPLTLCFLVYNPSKYGETHHLWGPTLHMGVSINGDIQNGWFISWKFQSKWMMTGGSPILGNPQMSSGCKTSIG